VKLRHEFEVPASPAETLALLLDPERVVSCMPGAELVEVADGHTWKTTMAVKLGPVGMDFLNDVRIVDQDAGAGTVRLSVRGREKRGRGAVDAGVDARLEGTDGGGTTVTMETDVRFSGQAAQLGRPALIEDVSTRLVGDFARCVGTQLGSTQLGSTSGPREGGSP
jgi:carbon monoxide dehydrogenase subunit G